jgi:hypothetical protein
MRLTRRWFSGSLWASTSGGVVAMAVPTVGALAADAASVLDFGADPTAIQDASTAFQTAIDLVAGRGGGQITVPTGRYLVGELQLRAKTYLVGVGRFSYGAARFMAPSVLARRPGARNILQAEQIVAFGVENLELDGNTQAGGGGNGLDLTDCGSIVVSHCKFTRFAVGIETFLDAGSRYSGDLHVTKTMFRNNRIGLRLGQDSQVEGSDFSANTLCGAYVNAGQARILGCRFEWNRDGERGAADGVYLYRNANEITLANCTFDRNAGHDLRVAGDADKRPRQILVVGNLFKRAAWGTDAEPSTSALVTAADDVSITGNLYQFAGHEPAPIEGMPSPLQAASFMRSNRISFTANALAGVGTMLPLGPPSYGWVRSAAGWYLTRPRNRDGNPWLRRPEDVILSAGNGPMDWRNADWTFGDHDGLGYDTLYLRGDDPAAYAIHAVYTDPPVSFMDCADVQTDDLRDFAVARIGPGEKGAPLLRTRLLGWPAGTRLLRLFLSLRSNGEGSSGDALFEFILTSRRERPVGTQCVARMVEGGTNRSALGLVGAETGETLEARPAPLGDVVEIVLRNMTAHQVEAGLSLLW